MSTWSEINPFRRGRFFHLPIHSTPLAPESEWEQMSGGVRLKSFTGDRFARALEKARSGSYSTVVFPINSVLHPRFFDFVAQTRNNNLQPLLQLSSESLQTVWASVGPQLLESPLKFELIVKSWPEDDAALRELLKQERLHITLAGFRGAPIWSHLNHIPLDFYPALHFYFPYQYKRAQVFAPWEIVQISRHFEHRQKGFVMRPPLGMDIHEPRIQEHCELECMSDPIFRKVGKETPKITVVIPTYNSGRQLMNTLSHLNEQTLATDSYEVVVVDDGSSDDTSERLLQQEFSMHRTYVYYPRLTPRRMGDSQFRAGLARNVGVKWARGEYLVFLDADIIVNKDFLAKTLELHKSWDVVQWRRDYLSSKAPSPEVRYSDVRKEDCYIPEGGYWHDFFQEVEKKPWGEIADHWKYACTYAFSLSRERFMAAGWFRKTFCFYGLEDTDLGWRLSQAGSTFHLQNEPVYHLYQEHERSEFKNSTALRQKLLKNTMRIFFNNNLDPKIYQAFKVYLKDNWFF